MNKKGFVLVETIAVVSVLCIIMVMLYAAYNNIVITLENKKIYDNTEYIYKTVVIRDYLKNETSNTSLRVICEKNCNDNLYKFMGVVAIYITDWDSQKIEDSRLSTILPTSQRYIKQIDASFEPDGTKRLVVAYKDENEEISDENKLVYQYASLKILGE